MLATLTEKVDPKHAALLVIDVQNDFCHPKGAVAQSGKDVSRFGAIVAPLNRLIAEARRAGLLVVFIRVTLDETTMSEVYRERHMNRPVPCREGTWGAGWCGVTPAPGDPVVTKHRHSAFFNTDLDTVLRAKGIRTILTTGVALGGCVEGTARHGFMLDYYVVCVDDCCGAGSEQEREHTLRWIAHGVGVVAQSEDIIRAWERVPQTGALAG